MIRYLKPLKWLDHTGGLNKAWQDPLNKIARLGREPWSSGYGRRLTFESQCRLLDGHDIFSHLIVVKIVMCF